MPKSAFDRLESASRDLSAYIVTDGGRPFARIIFKWSRGFGSVRAFVNRIGAHTPMVDGVARGGGYDRKSAALADAMRRLPAECSRTDKDWEALTGNEARNSFAAWRDGRGSDLIAALSRDDGKGWDGALRAAGFDIVNVV